MGRDSRHLTLVLLPSIFDSINSQDLRLLLRRGKRLGSRIPWQPATRRRCQNLTRKGDNNKINSMRKNPFVFTPLPMGMVVL